MLSAVLVLIIYFTKIIKTIISIRNTITATTRNKKLNGDFLTDKKDKFLHGIGLKNIRLALEKYNGELNFKYDNSFFETHVIIEDDISIMENIYEK